MTRTSAERMSAPVLVTGARGKTGREVAAQLEGVEVRAGTSSPAAAGDGLTPVAFDWAQPDGWPAAVEGVGAIYLMRPDVEDAPERVGALVELAPQAHVVLLSEQGAGDLPADGWEQRTEAAVTERARSWTLLRPSWFQQVFTDERYFRDSLRDRGELALPSSGAGLAWVDARDIAAVAVAALLDPVAHDGRAYTITGPAALTVSRAAELIGAAAGRTVTAFDASIAEATAGMDGWLEA